ncbi:MAG: hypothetical protein JNL62_16375 [Bryobacterales bacterium]|nr:hypothetical protein [Bryobacterales bacterium]
MRFMRVLLLGVGVMMLAAGPAMSAVFTDRATWQAALASRQEISFNAMSSTAYFNMTHGAGADTAFLAPINKPWFWIVTNAYGNSCDIRCLWTEAGGSETGVMAVMALATNTAVGFNVFTVNNTAQSVTVRIFNVGSATPNHTATVATVANSSTTPAFFGYTGTAGIQRVEIVTQPGTGDLVLDNFSFGVANNEPPPPPPPSETPEVPTLSYFGIGFIAVLIGSRRKAVR